VSNLGEKLNQMCIRCLGIFFSSSEQAADMPATRSIATLIVPPSAHSAILCSVPMGRLSAHTVICRPWLMSQMTLKYSWDTHDQNPRNPNFCNGNEPGRMSSESGRAANTGSIWINPPKTFPRIVPALHDRQYSSLITDHAQSCTTRANATILSTTPVSANGHTGPGAEDIYLQHTRVGKILVLAVN
jgi:hypothetical protein